MTEYKHTSPNQAFEILKQYNQTITSAKSLLIYFLNDMTTSQTFKHTTVYTITPIYAVAVINKGYTEIFKGINTNLFPNGISWSVKQHSYQNKVPKTGSKINILQILVKEDVFEKKPTEFDDEDEIEIIRYHKYQITTRTKTDKDKQINQMLLDEFNMFCIAEDDDNITDNETTTETSNDSA